MMCCRYANNDTQALLDDAGHKVYLDMSDDWHSRSIVQEHMVAMCIIYLYKGRRRLGKLLMASEHPQTSHAAQPANVCFSGCAKTDHAALLHTSLLSVH